MNKTRESTKQLDAEIIRCVSENVKISGYGIVKLISAPPMTIRYRLKVLVKDRLLDCSKIGNAFIYRLPRTSPGVPETKSTTAPKMVSRGPKAGKIEIADALHAPPKLFSSGKPRRGKSLAAMAFEGNRSRSSVSREA